MTIPTDGRSRPSPLSREEIAPESVVAGPVQGGPTDGGSGTGRMVDLTATFGGLANPLLVWLATTTGGVLIFLLLLRRSRDDDAWSNGLVLAAASPGPVAARGARARRSAATRAAATPAAATQSREAPEPPRVHARAFEKPPKEGIERARVGYRRVRISSKPDAVRSVELGRLDRGDEVEILDSYEGFLQVRTPDDITGWILRHTIVGAPTD